MGLKDDGSPMTMECAEWLIATPVAQSQTTNSECKCVIPVTINESLKNDVIFYYGLDNFYQNHRRYHSSRNDEQLLGDLSNVQGCKPFQATEDGTVILPCGAIANSMFNDTFSLKYKLPIQNSIPVDEIVPMTYKGILSKSYIESKFRNPSDKNLTRAFAGYAKPPAWSKRLEMLDKANPANNGLQNTDFMVWMAAAALPSFRKPWRMLDRNASDNFKDGLPAGNYTLHVTYNYPVLQFDGGKRFIITSKSWLGSKNYFTGVAFCSVGLICLINGVVFCIIQFKFGHPS